MSTSIGSRLAIASRWGNALLHAITLSVCLFLLARAHAPAPTPPPHLMGSSIGGGISGSGGNGGGGGGGSFTGALGNNALTQTSTSTGATFELAPPLDYSTSIVAGSGYTTIATIASGLATNVSVEAWFNVTMRGEGSNSIYQSQFSQQAIVANIGGTLTDLTGTLSGGVLATDYTQASQQSTGLPGASVKITGSGTSWVVACKPPAGVDVVCALDGLQYTAQRARQPLAYVPVAGVSPAGANVGTPVAVTISGGENLATVTGCTINSLACTSVASVGDSGFTFTSPSGLTAGTYPIVVSGSSTTAFPGGTYTIPGVSFTVTNASTPTITGIDSFWATAEGVTGINRVVSGTGFSGAVTLTITWSNAATTAITTGSGALTVLSSTSLQINNWPAAPQDGLASFTVTTAAGTSAPWASATAGDGMGVGVLPAGAFFVVDPAVGKTLSGSLITALGDRVTGHTQSATTIGSLTAPTYAASGVFGRPEIQCASNGSSTATGLVMTLASAFTGTTFDLVYIGQVSAWRNFSQVAAIALSTDTDAYLHGGGIYTQGTNTTMAGFAGLQATTATVTNMSTTPLTGALRALATAGGVLDIDVNGALTTGTWTAAAFNANNVLIGSGNGGAGAYPKAFSQVWGANKITFLAGWNAQIPSGSLTRMNTSIHAYVGSAVSL